MVGAEALVRWHHPTLGAIPPDEFIPLAEHTGLIRPLTLHVLELALRRRAAWRGPATTCTWRSTCRRATCSTRSCRSGRAAAARRPAARRDQLTLEITESGIMADPAGSLAALERLHALGVQLSIDDFGTGYSSLGQLRELPVARGEDRQVVRAAR